eukprot:scaffold6877_cov56-Cylindrotheca_fusiformis.AAC.3
MIENHRHCPHQRVPILLVCCVLIGAATAARGTVAAFTPSSSSANQVSFLSSSHHHQHPVIRTSPRQKQRRRRRDNVTYFQRRISRPGLSMSNNNNNNDNEKRKPNPTQPKVSSSSTSNSSPTTKQMIGYNDDAFGLVFLSGGILTQSVDFSGTFLVLSAIAAITTSIGIVPQDDARVPGVVAMITLLVYPIVAHLRMSSSSSTTESLMMIAPTPDPVAFGLCTISLLWSLFTWWSRENEKQTSD